MVAKRMCASFLAVVGLAACSADAVEQASQQPSASAPDTLPAADSGSGPATGPDTPDAAAVDAAVLDAAASDSAVRASAKPTLPANYARPVFCDREGRNDAARTLFCANPAAGITSLADLEAGLGLKEPEVVGTIFAGAVVLAHSTSLSGDVVSELNPRTIVTIPGLFVAFSRGVQQVEITAYDRAADHQNFYLVTFRQACNAAEGGCVPGDLYTPRIESDWLTLVIEDDEDLKNSPSDCRQCHQRGIEKPVLLMREFDGPWTHFFGPDQEDPEGFPETTGTGLLNEYLRAKGDERYSNLSSTVMRSTVGFTLQNLVARPQPLIFDGSQIMNERWPWTEADGYPAVPAKSANWYAQYEAFKRGEQLPMPYFEPRVSDKAKQEKLTAAYQRYRSGELPAEELPDFADIFPDDPQVRAEIGLQTEPGATPAQTLVQACASCHNDVLDQSISRARFNVALGRMSREEIELAIARLQTPRDALIAMPPLGRRQIGADKLAQLIAYLKQEKRTADDDALLERAATLGMAGPKTERQGVAP